jgi:glutaredoxin
MKVIIYSKEGCEYCDHAKTLCESEGLDHEKVMVDKEELKKLCGGSVQPTLKYLLTDRHIGSYFDFQDYIEDEYEPILAPP